MAINAAQWQQTCSKHVSSVAKKKRSTTSADTPPRHVEQQQNEPIQFCPAGIANISDDREVSFGFFCVQVAGTRKQTAVNKRRRAVQNEEITNRGSHSKKKKAVRVDGIFIDDHTNACEILGCGCVVVGGVSGDAQVVN